MRFIQLNRGYGSQTGPGACWGILCTDPDTKERTLLEACDKLYIERSFRAHAEQYLKKIDGPRRRRWKMQVVKLIESFELVEPTVRVRKPSVPSQQKPIPVGTVLVHSIGSGHDRFFQVVKSSPQSVTVFPIEYNIVKRYPKMQSIDIVPDISRFDTGGSEQKLRVAEDGRIGPMKRLMWWRIWTKDDKPLNQYSS